MTVDAVNAATQLRRLICIPTNMTKLVGIIQHEGQMMTDKSKTLTVEEVKAASSWLRGNVAQELQADSTSFEADTAQILKFHGVYVQDNRDTRTERIRAKVELDHRCMIRVAIPGGRLSADQYLALDALTRRLGSSSLRLTTRQGIQFHFVAKADLGELMNLINETLLTTWGGCGDVVRNVTACPSSDEGVKRLELDELAQIISLQFKAPSDAYYELWIDGTRVPNQVLGAAPVAESVYGPTMLPRKFKIGLTTSRDNCVDVFSCDVGLVVDINHPRRVRIYAGGGLGRSGTDGTTFARLGDLLGEVDRAQVLDVITAIVALHRDEGNREDRSHARLKYLVAARGVSWVRSEVERRSGVTIPAATPDAFELEDDHLGELATDNDHFDFGVKLPSGRIVNRENGRYLDGVAAIVGEFNPELAITARGDLIVKGVAVNQRDRLLELLEVHGIDAPEELSPLHRASFACVALPTCGLALAESERYLPEFLDEFHAMLAGLSMSEESFEVRMTGCPNGCARPYLGEIGIVGRSKRSYDIFIGADRHGTRLNTLFARDVDRSALVSGIEPLVRRYRDQRRGGESFGDFYCRLNDEDIASLRPASRQRRSRVTSKS